MQTIILPAWLVLYPKIETRKTRMNVQEENPFAFSGEIPAMNNLDG